MSLLDPYVPQIQRWVADTPELKATTLLERLRGLGFTGGITIVRDRVNKLRPREAKAFLTWTSLQRRSRRSIGQTSATLYPAVLSASARYVAVLGYSRLLYTEFTVIGDASM